MLEIKNLNITTQILKKYILVKYLVLIILIHIEKLYACNRKEIEYSFAHGVATNNIYFLRVKQMHRKEEIENCIQQNTESNNMVLGIDEYLSEDRRSDEIEFIAFKKKYYQRIYKKAGNEYKKWLQQIDENVKAGRKEENTLYIFGHSLDVTDGDVLREFINHENLKTVIFYRNKGAIRAKKLLIWLRY